MPQKPNRLRKDFFINNHPCYPTLESSAWWACPEMLLQSLLCSNDLVDREFAVKKILEIRERYEATVREKNLVRIHDKVKLNKEATTLQNLILWEEDKISEPILTLSLSKEENKGLKDTPIEVPDIPVHGQSVERCVKEVTIASESVFGSDRRDGFVRTRF